jgi:hypothetical protein
MGFVFTQTQMAPESFGRITSSNKTPTPDTTATMSGGKSLVSLDFECRFLKQAPALQGGPVATIIRIERPRCSSLWKQQSPRGTERSARSRRRDRNATFRSMGSPAVRCGKCARFRLL